MLIRRPWLRTSFTVSNIMAGEEAVESVLWCSCDSAQWREVVHILCPK